MMNLVSPSILASNFCQLSAEIKKMELAGADMLHLDVMDGHFVPNISFGQPLIKSIRPSTKLFFDVHLMISEPLRYAEEFINAGADSICFHVESNDDPIDVIQKIRTLDKKVAIAIKPQTSVDAIKPYLSLVDMILVMTVEPGFGGQSFIHNTMPKIKELRCIINQKNLPLAIQVDGGIDDKTVHIAKDAGANVFVTGTYLFKLDDPTRAIKEMQLLP